MRLMVTAASHLVTADVAANSNPMVGVVFSVRRNIPNH